MHSSGPASHLLSSVLCLWLVVLGGARLALTAIACLCSPEEQLVRGGGRAVAEAF